MKELHTPLPGPSLESSTRSASSGMLWVSIALVFAKFLSLISQLILGHVLTVETYAVFGLAATAVALTAGFQNPSVGKALIQSSTRFPELFQRYSAFTFQFGLIGTFTLVGTGAALAEIYAMPQLFPVLLISSLSVPILAANTTLVAGLSIGYRFRDINTIEIKSSLIYYFALVGAALLGAEAMTMAIATLLGSFAGHILLRSSSALRPSYLRLHPRDFVATLGNLRWVILSSFLLALAMRSDYFVLGEMLSVKELGYYTFAFMLVTSLTLPISAGINQVFLPIFARSQDDTPKLRQEVVRFSSAIVILGSVLCLLMLGMNAALMHLLWNDKWDPAHFIVNVLAIAMPFRFMGTIAGVGLEALGQWRLRNGLLVFEASLLAFFAAIGTSLAGIEGAIIGVVVQRVLGSLLSLAILGRLLRLGTGRGVSLILRLYVPFVAASALLVLLSPSRHGTESGMQVLGMAGVETLAALALFSVLAFLWNRSFLAAALDLVGQWIRRR